MSSLLAEAQHPGSVTRWCCRLEHAVGDGHRAAEQRTVRQTVQMFQTASAEVYLLLVRPSAVYREAYGEDSVGVIGGSRNVRSLTRIQRRQCWCSSLEAAGLLLV